MTWSVEFVSAVAEAELNALPLDMRSRFTRLATMFQEHGFAHALRKTLNRKAVGTSIVGTRRNCALDLRDGKRSADDRPADFCEEDRTNPAA